MEGVEAAQRRKDGEASTREFCDAVRVAASPSSQRMCKRAPDKGTHGEVDLVIIRQDDAPT